MKNYYVYLQYINDVVVYIGITTTPYHRPYYFGDRRNEFFSNIIKTTKDLKFSVDVRGPFRETIARGIERELIKEHDSDKLTNIHFTKKAKMPVKQKSMTDYEIQDYMERNPVKYY
jgi:hypothetical protein